MRIRVRFSLRALLLFTLLIAALLAIWLAVDKPFKLRRKAIAHFQGLGAGVTTVDVGPRWCRKLIGSGRFQDVSHVSFCPREIIGALEGLPTLWEIGPPANDRGIEARITPSDIALLNHFERLRSLDLTVTAIDDDTVKAIGTLTTLRNLDLTWTNVSNEAIRHLGGLRLLRQLGLIGLPITDQGLEELRSLEKLEVLSLASTQVTDAGMKEVSRHRRLRSLHLDGTSVSDKGMVHLRSLRRLQSLSITSTRVTDAGLAHLATLPRLRTLDVEGCELTERGLSALRNKLPHLRIDVDEGTRVQELIRRIEQRVRKGS